ncbi:MAG: selenide, water dikinase SelD [Candidatus Puniceispirillum sp.]
MKTEPPSLADLVFLGGGHAQVAALKYFAMNPIDGLRLTVVTPHSLTPYSGMLPAFVEGVWTKDDFHINLAHLAQMANARLIVAPCIGIDANASKIKFADRPDLHFDILSVNIGGQPDLSAFDGAAKYAIPVKPIGQFCASLEKFNQKGDPGQVAIIGGGAAGCELALSLNRQWKSAGKKASITLYSRSERLLPGMARRAGRLMRASLDAADISVRQGVMVKRMTANHLYLEDGSQEGYDAAFLVSATRPPSWLADTGLALSDNGFIEVGTTLQSTSHAHIFATGDIASVRFSPRPKAGVFAVRAGPVLARNLSRYLNGKQLCHWRAQRNYLALISTADGAAIACRGSFAVKLSAALKLKYWIDRRFMQTYQGFRMTPVAPPAAFKGLVKVSQPIGVASTDPAFAALRCLGCAAKASRAVLDDALTAARDIALTQGIDPSLLPQDALCDDVASLPALPAGHQVMQSVDSLSEIVSDPFLLGKIAVIHALSDLYAGGAKPISALAMINLPPARLDLQKDQLSQILSGAVLALGQAGVPLAGGHTSEGGTLSVGFAMTGHVPNPVSVPSTPETAFLVLTKPLGVGIIMAANMQQRARADWVSLALESMLCSNAEAALIFDQNQVIAATDVTGFGLARHALNLAMRLGSGGCVLALDQIPLLAGAETLATDGIESSLAAQNRASVPWLDAARSAGSNMTDGRTGLLFDPQTSGGLLGVFDKKRAEATVASLQKLGHQAAIVGYLNSADTGVIVQPEI